MKRWTFLALIMVLALCGLQFAAAQESTPESTSGGAPEQIELVLSALSTEVGQTVALTDLDAYQWNQQMFNDASLGCPEPDTLYAQVITPGFQFLLSFGGLTYDYRVAEANDEVRLCGVSDTPLTTEATPEATEGVGSGVISFENVRFTVDPVLGLSNVAAQTIPATEDVEGAAYFGVLPEYIQFAFEGFPGGEAVNIPALLNVYPVSDYEAIREDVADLVTPEIDALRMLLEERPDFETVEDVPYLPLVNAVQAVWAQPQYLDFEGGSGVRYVTTFQQAAEPITNSGLFYTFQGITDDGQYYISASFPVSTSVLPEAPTVEATEEAFDSEANRTEVIALLNPLAEEEFVPDLTLLDNLIQSMVVEATAG
jgi:hypothetical protein